MQRIVHVTQAWAPGGVPIYLKALVADQRERGFDVAVASPARGPLVEALAELEVRHLPWDATRSIGRSTPGEVRRLRSIIDDADPDVVHLHSSKAGLAGRLAVRNRRPTIFQPHGWSWLGATSPLMTRGASRWERAATRWTTLLVCGSEGELRTGQQIGIDVPAVVVPNTVDLTRFTPVDEGEHLEAKRQIEVRGPLVVCVGRLCRQKSQDVLLRSWKTVREHVPDAELVLVGDGDDHDALVAAAPASVRFVGWQDDVRPWLAAADLVVQPSRYETLSLSLLEAVGSERPCVASDCDGMREALGEDHTGVVPVEDADALASAIVTRLVDPVLAASEARRCRDRALQRFSHHAWAEAMTQIYDHAVTLHASAATSPTS